MRIGVSFLVLSLVFLSVFSSCKKEGKTVGTPDKGAKIAPDNFAFSTTKEISVSVRFLTNGGEAVRGALLKVTDPVKPENVYLQAITDAGGYVTATMVVPSYIDTVLIKPDYIGLINNVKAFIGKKTTLSVVIGGPEGAAGDIVPERITVASAASGVTTMGAFATDYAYPSGYSRSSDAIVNTSQYPFNLGRPKYLEPVPDVIAASMLSYVNASLPEGKPLSVTHPEFLANSAVPNINMVETGDVWVTFVSEGASYRNTLAYYTYPTGSLPNSATGGTFGGGIDKITMVFPNASALNSSGGLKSGDKVKLGRFTAGTTIAFVLIQDGWTGSGVNSSNLKFYSDPKFNLESATSLKKHSVMLHDDVHNVFLFGFEDSNRQTVSDNDFNDLVVYATSIPVKAISDIGVSPVDKGNDDDGDGVLNDVDEFPSDPSRAYTTYYPSKNGWSTLAFEDSWPKTGDYDLNDLVVNYRYAFIQNASNSIVEMKGEFQPVAAGADYKNGFGVELPFSYDKVSAVTGQSFQAGTYITRNSNGTEAGQKNAVIIPFDNTDNLIKNPDNSTLVNTVPGKAWITPVTVSVNITMASPVAFSVLGRMPFNPFLISNQRRGYEMHLPGKLPTDKANITLFGTEEDRSSAASGMYYLSGKNWPWGLNFPDSFSYPVEISIIGDAYPHFLEWAQSGGSLYPDWFSSTAIGYRNLSKIYSR